MREYENVRMTDILSQKVIKIKTAFMWSFLMLVLVDRLYLIVGCYKYEYVNGKLRLVENVPLLKSLAKIHRQEI